MAQDKDDPVGVEFAKAISSFVNGNRSASATAVRHMLRDHRTIQQGMMRLFMQFAEGMADQETDLRNEASVALAQEIMAIDSRTRALPYV
tara:strand:+ start:552 stop:821 length:270 start_codon:yes stop_codon:yes gene_type:complete